MAELNDIVLFEKARKGSLSETERTDFESRLKSDKDFLEDFKRYEQVIADIKQQQTYEDLMVQLNEIHKSADWSAPTGAIRQRDKSGFTWIYWLLAVVAVAVVAFFIARSFYSNKDTSADEAQVETSNIEPTQEPNVAVTDSVVVEDYEPGSVAELVDAAPNPTAFMISESGYFVTQYSQIKSARSLRLRQNDSTEYKVNLLFHDPEHDVAILRLADVSWPRNLRLPYRLATTQAFGNTEVMAVAGSGATEFDLGYIKSLDADGDRDFYTVELENNKQMSGGVLLSRNGNVVAFVKSANDSLQFVKSTELVGLLARHASDPDMSNYLPAADNRLAGLEREAQREIMSPFVLEVIRFY